MNTVFLNGTLMPAHEARISPFDRGFLFGDGVYEVVPFYEERAFGWDAHILRFERSLEAVNIPNPYAAQEWRDMAKQLLKANGGTQLMYWQVTRGVSQPRKQTFVPPLVPTVFASSAAFTPVNTVGSSAITVTDDRWRNCYIKSLNLLPNVLAMQTAKDQGAVEAILVRDGYVTEGASSSVFVIKNNTVLTAPLDGSILSGTSRSFLIQVLKELGTPAIEHVIPAETLHNADEIWITSVGKEITPITLLNHKPVGSGKSGPLWEHIYPLYQSRIEHEAKSL